MAIPVPPVTVVDTVGAGDSFGGGFLAWWAEHRLTRNDLADLALLQAALTAATQFAAMTCGRAGADPPSRQELDNSEHWNGSVACLAEGP